MSIQGFAQFTGMAIMTTLFVDFRVVELNGSSRRCKAKLVRHSFLTYIAFWHHQTRHQLKRIIKGTGLREPNRVIDEEILQSIHRHVLV